MTREQHVEEHGTKTIFTEDWGGERHKYGYTNRPHGMCHQPKGYIIFTLDEGVRIPEKGVRHGTIEYPFALTDHEVNSYELVPLPQSTNHLT